MEDKKKYPNLVDISKRPNHQELSIKGGKSRSPRKLWSSTITLMLSNPKLTDEQKYLYLLLKDKRFADLVVELVGMNMIDIDDAKRRDKIIDQLSRFLPTVNLNVNTEAEDSLKKLKEYLLSKDGEQEKN